jgi:hypothetical protein
MSKGEKVLKLKVLFFKKQLIDEASAAKRSTEVV